MYSLAIVTSFLSVWCLYAISERVDFVKKNITLVLSKNTKATQIVALVFFFASTFVLCFSLGLVTGIFSSLLIWMTLASSVLLFAPFPKLKYTHLILLGVLIIIIESLFTITY
ncbi:hypothetical protein [Aquimarina aquimarini]|uniref:hypothetical protein n=1 Tax=Aquimarina aquimarini TaxID=1191734 RepID=UPI00131EFC92|nr:hypothetical protein [Aquimarina aquimarini]